jgi:hypothetical protein
MDPDIGQKVSNFCRHAIGDMLRDGDDDISCLCSKCKDQILYDPFHGNVKLYMLRYGFMEGYRHDDNGAADEVLHDHEEGGNNNEKEPHEGGNQEALKWDLDDEESGQEREVYTHDPVDIVVDSNATRPSCSKPSLEAHDEP